MEIAGRKAGGIDVSKKGLLPAQELLGAVSGSGSMYQVRKQVRKFSDFSPLPESLRQLWELAVKHGMTKSILAPLFRLAFSTGALEGYGDPYLLSKAA